MADIKKHRFKKVYYIVQVVPVFKTCGHTFDFKEAKKMSRVVEKYTGIKGRIIEFSRDELCKLA